MAEMMPEDYIGKTFMVDCAVLALPTGRDVVQGDTFRLLAEHVARGCRPDLWIATGNAHVVADAAQKPGGGMKGGAVPAPAPAPDPVPPVATAAPGPAPVAAGGKG